MEALDPEMLKGFGLAAPVILVLIWLLVRAEMRADRYEREMKQVTERYIEKLPIIVEVARDATRALENMNRRVR